ncbi:MAG: hypothetical protein KME09_07215 [Pleurocapsa minor HA4230-MV1]|nr:hypothetical protein [Pleurocapsa minor HA4230-MV1]
MTITIDTYPVRKKQCATCPFRTDSTGRHPDPMLVSRIQQQCLTEASQICHHPRLIGKPKTHLCRGAREWNISELAIASSHTPDNKLTHCSASLTGRSWDR